MAESGFTPAYDCIVQDLGPIPAIVYGVVWRFCQMDDGVCKASQNKIAARCGISYGNARLQLGKLVDAGYLIGEEIKGVGIIYTTTDKVHPAQIEQPTPRKLSSPPRAN